MSERARRTESVAGRLSRRLRKFVRRRQPYLGWDPREPTCLGLAIALLIASVIMPWWGVSTETFDPRHAITRVETVQFGPWLTTHWYSSVAPGFFVLQASPILWWDYPREFPAYAPYSPVSAVLCAFWSAALVVGAGALWARGVPRRRFSGWPTIAEAAVAALGAAGILATVFGFPPVGGHTSFAGASADGRIRWGPGLGWYAAVGVAVLAVASMSIGFLVDRKLVGVCWFCFRSVTGPRCQHCGSVQRRVSRRAGPIGIAAESLGPPTQKP